MNAKENFGKSIGQVLISPRFSLLRCPDILYDMTESAIPGATQNERLILMQMRRYLDKWVSGSNRFCDILSEVKQDLSKTELPENTVFNFPGYIDELPEAHEEIKEILRISENLTFDISSPSAAKLLGILTADTDVTKSVNIITSSHLSDMEIKPVAEALLAGSNIILCNSEAVLSHQRSPVFDVYGGITVLPGITVVKNVPVDWDYILRNYDPEDGYLSVKSYICDILESEESKRYTNLKSQNPIRRKSTAYKSLAPFGMLYSDFIDSNANPVLQFDRDEFNIINIAVTSEGDIDEATETELMMFPAGCKFADGFYKTTAVSSFRDIRYAKSISDLKRIIMEHTEIVRFMTGGSVLELSVEKTLLDTGTLASFINEFFGCEGMMIKIKFH